MRPHPQGSGWPSRCRRAETRGARSGLRHSGRLRPHGASRTPSPPCRDRRSRDSRRRSRQPLRWARGSAARMALASSIAARQSCNETRVTGQAGTCGCVAGIQFDRRFECLPSPSVLAYITGFPGLEGEELAEILVLDIARGVGLDPLLPERDPLVCVGRALEPRPPPRRAEPARLVPLSTTVA